MSGAWWLFLVASLSLLLQDQKGSLRRTEAEWLNELELSSACDDKPTRGQEEYKRYFDILYFVYFMLAHAQF